MSVRKLISLLLILVVLTAPVTFALSFNDVGNYKWAQPAIDNMVINGFINGYEDGTFRPEANITRAQLVSIINTMNGFTEEAPMFFKDVSDKHWAYKQIRIAVAAGYVNGFEDGTFRPNAFVTRQQVAAIINNLYHLENTTLSVSIKDLSKISGWAVQAVVNVVANGIIALDAEGNFEALTPITRVDGVVSLNNIVIKDIPTIEKWLVIKENEVEQTTGQGGSTGGVVTQPPATSDTLDKLNTVLLRLNSRTIPSLTTNLQRETANIIVQSISAYIADQNYSTSSDVSLAKSKVSLMSKAEYQAFKNAITSNILLSDLVALNEVFQLISY